MKAQGKNDDLRGLAAREAMADDAVCPGCRKSMGLRPGVCSTCESVDDVCYVEGCDAPGRWLCDGSTGYKETCDRPMCWRHVADRVRAMRCRCVIAKANPQGSRCGISTHDYCEEHADD